MSFREVVLRVPVAAGLVLIWVMTMSAPAHAQADPRRGREVFEQSCAMCHGQDASGMMGMHPSLRGAVERLSREGVEVTIRQGRDTTPPMPSFEGRITDKEIADVIAYLDTLPAGPRNFGPRGDAGMMTDGMMGGGMWAWFVWSTLFVLFVAAIVVGAVFLVRRFGSGTGEHPPSRDAALDILKQRFARGEIDREEFDERRRALSGDA
ncbi:MAG: c-type cytochrome [Actinomycetota bacterium]